MSLSDQFGKDKELDRIELGCLLKDELARRDRIAASVTEKSGQYALDMLADCNGYIEYLVEWIEDLDNELEELKHDTN